MKPRFKIFGERNSGTRYLELLIRQNYDAVPLPGSAPTAIQVVQHILPGREWARDCYFSATADRNLGWKHGLVRERQVREWLGNLPFPVGVVTLTKNPYSWLLSLYRRPHHDVSPPGSSFREFLQRPWRGPSRDGGPNLYRNPIEIWNRKNRSYLELAALDFCRPLTYESLLEDPERTVRALAEAFDWRPGKESFSPIHESTSDPSRSHDDYRAYYLGEEWRSSLAPNEIHLINEHLDLALLEAFGYRKLEPEGTIST